MDSEIFQDDCFVGNEEKSEQDVGFGGRINLSWARVLVCFLIFAGLIICRYFNVPYYTKIGEFYSENFKKDDITVFEYKNFVIEKFKELNLKIKEKINNL